MTRHHPQRPHVDDPVPAIARAKAHARPIVAIVGRPNVGKSTLFNRLVGARIAIVHDEPGVTRDRNYADAFSRGVEYTLIDTGGYDPDSDDPMRQGIARHVRGAIEEADVVVAVLDGTTDVTSADREAVQLLRQSKRPVIWVANKADSPSVDALAFDHYRLGIQHILPVSSLHGRGIGELEEAIIAALPEPEDIEDPFAELGIDLPRVALIGRPNAGKSSLLNRLVGEERSLVDSRPGTTRDTIDALVRFQLKTDDTSREVPFVLIDTAGIRRKSKVQETVESVSVMRAVRAIERAEVIVLMCDADEGVAEQDAKILGLALDRGRAIVIALNKCDLLDQKQQKKAEELAREKLSFTPWAPIVRFSAMTGRGMGGLVDTIVKTRAEWKRRVTTGALNRFFEEVLATHPPPTMNGRYVRLYYVTQAESAPPTFVVVTNEPDSVHFSYRRYVENRIRQQFGFSGTPIRIRYKPKRRRAIGAERDREAAEATRNDEEDDVVTSVSTSVAKRSFDAGDAGDDADDREGSHGNGGGDDDDFAGETSGGGETSVSGKPKAPVRKPKAVRRTRAPAKSKAAGKARPTTKKPASKSKASPKSKPAPRAAKVAKAAKTPPKPARRKRRVKAV